MQGYHKVAAPSDVPAPHLHVNPSPIPEFTPSVLHSAPESTHWLKPKTKPRGHLWFFLAPLPTSYPSRSVGSTPKFGLNLISLSAPTALLSPLKSLLPGMETHSAASHLPLHSSQREPFKPLVPTSGSQASVHRSALSFGFSGLIGRQTQHLP